MFSSISIDLFNLPKFLFITHKRKYQPCHSPEAYSNPHFAYSGNIRQMESYNIPKACSILWIGSGPVEMMISYLTHVWMYLCASFSLWFNSPVCWQEHSLLTLLGPGFPGVCSEQGLLGTSLCQHLGDSASSLLIALTIWVLPPSRTNLKSLIFAQNILVDSWSL